MNLVLLLSPIILLTSSLFLIRFALVVVTVTGRSMAPTIEDGDRVVVLRRWPAAWLRKGQIVLLRPVTPEHLRAAAPLATTPSIKRVVGLPGDRIATHITELKEHNRVHLPWVYDRQGWRLWDIAPGYCFVRGDNRAESIDSLVWGPVHVCGLQGLVVMKLSRRDARTSGQAAVLEPGAQARAEEAP
jgi:signal peptidase I